MQWMDFCGNKICLFLFFYFLKKSEIWHTDLSTQLGTSSTWQNVILKFINTFILYIKYDFCPSIIFFFFFQLTCRRRSQFSHSSLVSTFEAQAFLLFHICKCTHIHMINHDTFARVSFVWGPLRIHPKI